MTCEFSLYIHDADCTYFKHPAMKAKHGEYKNVLEVQQEDIKMIYTYYQWLRTRFSYSNRTFDKAVNNAILSLEKSNAGLEDIIYTLNDIIQN